MHGLGKRGWFLLGLGLLAVPLVGAALAYGCAALATLEVSPGAGPAGSAVTIDGRGFGTHDVTSGGTNGPAEIRLGSLTGPVLATAAPTGSDGRFSVQVTVPPGSPPGDTFFTATQKTITGGPVYGTPARRAFTVTAPPATNAPSGGAGPGLVATAPPNVFLQMIDRQAAMRKASARRKAVARCKRRYSPRKAKSATAKKRMARRRAACIRRARARYR